MARFLRANPGLASRFTEHVEFPDYTGGELVTILAGMAAKEGFTLDPGATSQGHKPGSRRAAPAKVRSSATAGPRAGCSA